MKLFGFPVFITDEPIVNPALVNITVGDFTAYQQYCFTDEKGAKRDLPVGYKYVRQIVTYSGNEIISKYQAGRMMITEGEPHMEWVDIVEG